MSDEKKWRYGLAAGVVVSLVLSIVAVMQAGVLETQYQHMALAGGDVSDFGMVHVAAPTAVGTATPGLMVDCAGVSNCFEIRDAATPVWYVADGGGVVQSGESTYTGLLNADGGIAVDTSAFTVADATGATIVSGTLTVTDTSALIGATTVTGALAANGGLTMDTSKFIVHDTSGNTEIAGTLVVTDTSSLIGATTVTGALAADGGLTMDTSKFVVADTSGNTDIAGTLTVTGTVTAGGNVSLGDAIGDSIYVYGQMRSYDGSDNWADVSSVSDLGRANGWHAAYNVIGWGTGGDFQALFANTQVTATSASKTFYGGELKATLKAVDASGTTTGIGAMGKVVVKTTADLPEAYGMYSRLETDGASDTIALGANFMADLDNSGTITASNVLLTEGDTWTNGINFSAATLTNDIVLQNSESINNSTNGLIGFVGGLGLSATSITDTQTITPLDYSWYTINSTAEATITLAACSTAGQPVILYCDDAQTVNVADSDLFTSDGAKLIMDQYDLALLFCNGADWVLLYESNTQ